MKYYVFLIALTVGFYSCSSGIYAPGNKRIYTPHEEKQLLSSGSTYISPSFVAAEFDVSYSPLKNLGVQTFFDLSNRYRSAGLAIGLYKANYSWFEDNLKKGLHFDGYLGYSLHKAQRNPAGQGSFLFDEFGYNTSYQDISLNLGMHFAYKYFGADIYFKPHLIDLYKVRLSGDFNPDVITAYNQLGSSPFLVYDMGAQLALGDHDMRAFGGVNLSISQRRTRHYTFIDPISISGGININIGNFFSGRSRNTERSK